MTARALEERGIRLEQYQHGEHRASCPECDRGPKDDALAVRMDDDGATWLCHRCGWSGGIREGHDEPLSKCSPKRHERQPEPEHYEVLAPWVNASGRLASDRAGTVAGSYLEHRGCALPPFADETHLRWHPDLPDRVSGYRGPALVALVTDVETGAALNIHRTWLAPEGIRKAPIDKPRRLLRGHRSRGVARLWPDEEVTLGIVVGEGLETRLAAARAGSIPVWSTLTAGNLAAFPVLRGLDGLTILVDHDRPNPKTGRRAGIERLEP